MKPNPNIQCVFFDLGSVLVHVDIDKCLQQFAKNSAVSLTQWIEAVRTNGGIMREFDLGRITPHQFYQQTRDKLGLRLSYNEFVQVYCGIFSLNLSVVNWVKMLASKVTLSIVSNTDPLHFEYILHTFEMMSLFEKPTTSFQVGIMKPEPDIYRHAMNKIGVSPEESIFIDDRIENVEGAQAVGMYGIIYNDRTDLGKEFFRFGLKLHAI